MYTFTFKYPFTASDNFCWYKNVLFYFLCVDLADSNSLIKHCKIIILLMYDDHDHCISFRFNLDTNGQNLLL